MISPSVHTTLGIIFFAPMGVLHLLGFSDGTSVTVMFQTKETLFWVMIVLMPLPTCRGSRSGLKVVKVMRPGFRAHVLLMGSDQLMWPCCDDRDGVSLRGVDEARPMGMPEVGQVMSSRPRLEVAGLLGAVIGSSTHPSHLHFTLSSLPLWLTGATTNKLPTKFLCRHRYHRPGV